jgi:hypothetical protein
MPDFSMVTQKQALTLRHFNISANYTSHITDLVVDALPLKFPFLYFQHIAALEEKETQNNEGSARNRPCLCLASWRKCQSETQARKS